MTSRFTYPTSIPPDRPRALGTFAEDDLDRFRRIVPQPEMVLESNLAANCHVAHRHRLSRRKLARFRPFQTRRTNDRLKSAIMRCKAPRPAAKRINIHYVTVYYAILNARYRDSPVMCAK
jgi:hypothetical protein